MKIEDIIKSSPLTLSKQILMNIMFTQTILSEHINELLKAYDLSAEQFNVLRILRGQKGKPANMCVIQERMIAKTSNTTRLVDKLLAKKLVNREVCSDNRRKMEITITQKGLDLLSDLDPVVEQHENDFASNLNHKEQETLVALLEKYRSTEPQQ
jgi:DNA-binding MarR family transcriptional regulator